MKTSFLPKLITLIFLLTSSCTVSDEFTENDLNNNLKPAENRIVFVSNRDGQTDIYSIKPDGSEILRITNDTEIDTNPVWSPDKTQIAYTSYIKGEFDVERSKIFIINADGTGRRQLFDRPMGELFPSWSPDGTQILYTLRYIFLARIDGQNDETLLMDADFKILQAPSWSPDGKKIAFVALLDTGNEIRIMNSDGSDIRALTNGYLPAWSPDGKKIVFFTLVGKQNDIFVINADGSGIQQLTNSPEDDLSPDWSPDGKQIVFTSYRDGNANIYVMNANGSNQMRLTDNPAEDSSPAWRK